MSVTSTRSAPSAMGGGGRGKNTESPTQRPAARRGSIVIQPQQPPSRATSDKEEPPNDRRPASMVRVPQVLDDDSRVVDGRGSMVQHQSPPFQQEASSRATDHRPRSRSMPPRRGSATVYSPPGPTHIQSNPIHWSETVASATNQGGEENLTLPFMDSPMKQPHEQQQEVLTSPRQHTLIRSRSMSMINRRGSLSSNDEEEKQGDASLAAALEASSNHTNTLEESVSGSFPTSRMPMNHTNASMDDEETIHGFSASSDEDKESIPSSEDSVDPAERIQPSSNHHHHHIQRRTPRRTMARTNSTGALTDMVLPSAENLLLSVSWSKPLRSCLVRDTALMRNRKAHHRVVIDESKNLHYERLLPISKKEAETCWFTFKECKQMKADTSSYAFRSARYLANQDPNEMQNALAMGYKTCCETLEPLTKAQVGLIKKCLEQSRSTGLEQVLIESIKLISHDKKLRRQKMLAMVAYRSTISAELSEDEQAEMVRQKCAELSRPGELFALAIGQAQQQQVHRSGESGHTKAARRPSLWDRLRA